MRAPLAPKPRLFFEIAARRSPVVDLAKDPLLYFDECIVEL